MLPLDDKLVEKPPAPGEKELLLYQKEIIYKVQPGKVEPVELPPPDVPLQDPQVPPAPSRALLCEQTCVKPCATPSIPTGSLSKVSNENNT